MGAGRAAVDQIQNTAIGRAVSLQLQAQGFKFFFGSTGSFQRRILGLAILCTHADKLLIRQQCHSQFIGLLHNGGIHKSRLIFTVGEVGVCHLRGTVNVPASGRCIGGIEQSADQVIDGGSCLQIDGIGLVKHMIIVGGHITAVNRGVIHRTAEGFQGGPEGSPAVRYHILGSGDLHAAVGNCGAGLVAARKFQVGLVGIDHMVIAVGCQRKGHIRIPCGQIVVIGIVGGGRAQGTFDAGNIPVHLLLNKVQLCHDLPVKGRHMLGQLRYGFQARRYRIDDAEYPFVDHGRGLGVIGIFANGG